MQWLEIIELRTSDSNRKLLESRLRELINDVILETGRQGIKLYSHGIIETDFSIHIMHDSETVEHFGSRLGLHLASALREFGLVNHGIWVEMDTALPQL